MLDENVTNIQPHTDTKNSENVIHAGLNITVNIAVHAGNCARCSNPRRMEFHKNRTENGISLHIIIRCTQIIGLKKKKISKNSFPTVSSNIKNLQRFFHIHRSIVPHMHSHLRCWWLPYRRASFICDSVFFLRFVRF